MPYHVRITPKSDPSHVEVKLDLTREQLEERIVAPYREGRSIFIVGRNLLPNDNGRIIITQTDETSEKLIPLTRMERMRSPVYVANLTDEWYVAKRGRDVTDEFISGPPGVAAAEPHTGAGDPARVLVFSGRNAKAEEAMFAFLRSIGLHPQEWSQLVIATGKGSPYFGEILDVAFSLAQAAVVLMTPDDEARLREPLRGPNEKPHEIHLTPQARANVLFEAGMAMGRYEDRTIIVELGDLRPFSNVSGRHVIRLDNSSETRQSLAQRLRVAGCPVDLSGTDWHKAGDFEEALQSLHESPTADEGGNLEEFEKVDDLTTEITREEKSLVREYALQAGQRFKVVVASPDRDEMDITVRFLPGEMDDFDLDGLSHRLGRATRRLDGNPRTKAWERVLKAPAAGHAFVVIGVLEDYSCASVNLQVMLARKRGPA